MQHSKHVSAEERQKCDIIFDFAEHQIKHFISTAVNVDADLFDQQDVGQRAIYIRKSATDFYEIKLETVEVDSLAPLVDSIDEKGDEVVVNRIKEAIGYVIYCAKMAFIPIVKTMKVHKIESDDTSTPTIICDHLAIEFDVDRCFFHLKYMPPNKPVFVFNNPKLGFSVNEITENEINAKMDAANRSAAKLPVF